MLKHSIFWGVAKIAGVKTEERVQPGPGAHRLGMGLAQGQACTGRYSTTSVRGVPQASDRLSGSRTRPKTKPKTKGSKRLISTKQCSVPRTVLTEMRAVIKSMLRFEQPVIPLVSPVSTCVLRKGGVHFDAASPHVPECCTHFFLLPCSCSIQLQQAKG